MIGSHSVLVRRDARSTRHGGIMVIMPAILIVLLVVVAFAVDVGFVFSARSKLQSAADAAALAGALELRQGRNNEQMMNSSTDFAMSNAESYGEILKDADITAGHWDDDSRTFTSGGDQLNAVRVTARRNGLDNAKVPSFFMQVFGVGDHIIERSAVAKFDYVSTYAGLLFDDDMLHPEVPEIIQQAALLGVTPESLSTDQDGDGYLDAAAGTILDLPTGDGGKAGFFECTSEFPFQTDDPNELIDMLTFGTPMETSNLDVAVWDSSNAPHHDLIGEPILSAMTGVRPVSDSTILGLPAEADNLMYVAIVFENDIQVAQTRPFFGGPLTTDISAPRAGLLVFRILDSFRSASNRPTLRIQVVSPSSANLNEAGLRYELKPVRRVD